MRSDFGTHPILDGEHLEDATLSQPLSQTLQMAFTSVIISIKLLKKETYSSDINVDILRSIVYDNSVNNGDFLVNYRNDLKFIPY